MELLEGNEGRKRFRELVEGVKFAMLTTRATDGSLRSRPMFTQDVEFEGELWFFTNASSGKVDEIDAHPEVNVAYSKPDANLYLSASGTARVLQDAEKIRELWRPEFKIYFPDGPDDPDLVLLRIDVTEAEYWTGERNPILRLVGLAKALVTKNPDALGDSGRIELESRTS